jgi:hypothetical protein
MKKLLQFKTITSSFVVGGRFLGFALGFFLFIGYTYAEPVNPINNPGFEDNLTGWDSWGGTQIINTTNVHSGSNALEYTGEGGVAQSLSSGFAEGSAYTLSAWCVLPDGAIGKAYIGVQFVDAANAKVTLASEDITNSAAYELHELEFTIPAGTVGLVVYVYQEGGAKLIIDDFNLELNIPEVVNPISNSGFEDNLTGWDSWGGTQIINTTNVHSGSNALEYTGEGGVAQSLSSGFAAGSAYTLSAWCVLPDGATGKAYFGVQFVDAANAKVTLASEDITNSAAYELHELEFTIPAGTVGLVVYVYQEGGTKLIIDDFGLVLKNDTIPETGVQVGTGYNYSPSFLSVTGGGAMPDITDGYTCDCDGTGATDATKCLQAALDEAKDLGKPLLIPATSEYYKINGTLQVNTSVIGINGMPTIKQTSTKTGAVALRLVNNMTGWIYNLHIVGTYSGTGLTDTEFSHNISLGGVNGVTISNCLLELPKGDCITDNAQELDKNISRNVLITNNSLLLPSRCNISFNNISDRWAIMNNYLTYAASYVDPIDIEPYQLISFNTNIEIGYNNIQSPAPAQNDGKTRFYDGIVKFAGWFDPTPGGNVFVHHNYGDWGAPFTSIDGFKGARSTWTNLVFLNNAEGTDIPETDVQAPSEPTNLAISSVNKTSLTLSWTASDDDIATTGYLIFIGDSIVDSNVSTSYTFKNLNCGTVYPISVKAYDAGGNLSVASEVLRAATPDCGFGGTNLLTNPGYEDDLTGWGSWGGEQIITTVDQRSGIKAMEYTGEGGITQELVSGFNVGESYILSAWCVLPEGATGKAYLGVQFSNGEILVAPDITNTESFERIELAFTVPSGVTKFTVFIYQEGGSRVVADDWSLISSEAVASVTITPSTKTIPVGIVHQLTASVLPAYATNQKVVWSSNKPEIVEVSETGLIKGLAEGTATISVTTDNGGKTSTCMVTVNKSTENLIINPGFESALTNGWVQNWDNSEAISAMYHSGSKCIQIGSGDGGRAQPITGFIPGSTYTLSTWGLLNGTNHASQSAYFGVIIKDAGGTTLNGTSETITDSVNWQQYSITIDVPETATSFLVYVYFESRGIDNNYLLTDDWALIPGWTALPYQEVSVNNIATLGALKLYPNPLTGKTLNIEVEDGQSVSIYDMKGKLIHSQQLQPMNNGTQIDLSGIAANGLYIVKVATGKNTVSKVLIIK